MMKAFVLAAGLGTRLKPWTLSHPKALVPVGGVPMLERVLRSLVSQGFDDITINVHHFASQIIEFLGENDLGARIHISDESDSLLDTGGGLLHAREWLAGDVGPILVHNVDILSNACLTRLRAVHVDSANDISLLTTARPSSRKLIFGEDYGLRGWHNQVTGEYKPLGFVPDPDMHAHAFSGIYMVEPCIFDSLERYASKIGRDDFPIMDYLLSMPDQIKTAEVFMPDVEIIDIGKPETLLKADSMFSNNGLTSCRSEQSTVSGDSV